MNKIHLHHTVSAEYAGLRLDQVLARAFPQFSRSQMQRWIMQGNVRVDHKIMTKCKEKLCSEQHIALQVQLEDKEEWQPEPLPLDILFEDTSLLVLNKPPGLVVHPGAGNAKATLANALLHYDAGLKKIPRAGLIHRLDKDTSGLLIIARTLTAHHRLIAQMHAREIHRTYVAIVKGAPPPTGTINLPIGRHPTQRTKMAVLTHSGKPATTHFRLLEKFLLHSYLEIDLETGRTHQIRVHMSYKGYPILGDPLYGKPRNHSRLNASLREAIHHFKRQALHAKKLVFKHPISALPIIVEAPLPTDLNLLLEKLRLKA